MFRWTCGDDTRVRYHTLRTRLRVQRAPGIPHALVGRKIHAQLGRIAPRAREGVFEIVLTVEN